MADHVNKNFLSKFTQNKIVRQKSTQLAEAEQKRAAELKQEEKIRANQKAKQQYIQEFYAKQSTPKNLNLPETEVSSIKEKLSYFASKVKKPLVENTFIHNANPWELQMTPNGIFYFNKNTGQWMNSFGVVKNDLSEFLNFFDSSSGDGNSSNNQNISTPAQIVYESSLPLLRVVDADIYGYMVERNHDTNSIDEYYPEFPYTTTANGLETFGNLYNFLEIGASDVSIWDSGLAGRPFMGGALGSKGDAAAGSAYGEPGSNERTWATNWATTANAAPASLYDIGDTARRGVGSQYIEPSTFYKYQWYDFETNEVKGSNNISIASGYGGGLFIAKDVKKLSVPRTGYTSSITITSAIYDIILNQPSVWSVEYKNPDLIDSSNSYNITHSFGRNINNECNLSSFGELKEVAANVKNTLVIKADGSLGFRGFDLFGNLTANLPTGTGFIDIDLGGNAGSDFAIAARSNGTIAVWGRSPGSSQVIENIPGSVATKNIVQVSAGWEHIAILTDDGEVICWGTNNDGQCNVPSGMGTIVQVDANQFYTMALNSNGAVFVWGGKTDPIEPQYIAIQDIPTGLDNGTIPIQKISAGDYFGMALSDNRQVYCWGSTAHHDTSEVLLVPANIQGKVTDISAGAAHALASVGSVGYTAGQFVVGWGINTDFEGNVFNQATVPSTVYTGTSQTPYRLSAGHYHSLVLTKGGKRLSVAELYSNDLNVDGTDDVAAQDQVKLKHIDMSTDQCVATLDENGSIRLLYNTDTTPQGVASTGGVWESLIYFDKDWIANGFLTDDEGNAVFIDNEDFVSVTVSGGLLGALIYVWCLHKSGRLYGVELTSTGTVTNSPWKVVYNSKKEKFVTSGNPSSGRHSDFGTLPSPDVGPPPSAKPDEYRQYYGWSGSNVINSTPNGTCKEIEYVLNFIPKINGVRFPVTAVWGGYITGGVVTCINPTYTGYLPSAQDNFKHPTQMCEIVKLQSVINFSSDGKRMIKKIQKYEATYNAVSESWSYPLNSNFDQELYDHVFGVTLNVNGTSELSYVPPRCVSIQRFMSGNGNVEAAGGPGAICIFSNNGTWTPISGRDVYVPCTFDQSFNPNFVQEINTKNKVTMKGDFTLGTASYDYTTNGISPIFNTQYTELLGSGSRYKFGEGPNPLSPTLVVPTPTSETFDYNTMWFPATYLANTSGGWGNPPYINGSWLSPYGIPLDGTVSGNLFGFSYFDYFGSTASDPPSHLVKEGPYITNAVIKKVFAYGDTAGNYPVLLNGTINNSYHLQGNNIPVLAVGDEDILSNPFAWIRSVGDLAYGIRLDGTIDLLSQRNLNLDGYIFDPFWGACYPNDRYISGITFDSLKPVNYNDRLDQLKKVGSYQPGTYATYNYYLPNL